MVRRPKAMSRNTWQASRAVRGLRDKTGAPVQIGLELMGYETLHGRHAALPSMMASLRTVMTASCSLRNLPGQRSVCADYRTLFSRLGMFKRYSVSRLGAGVRPQPLLFIIFRGRALS